MADRPDIDALLISALYGELTPAEETRLSAHLETHPADRTVLADLTRAREVVRESRFLQFQAEPPQAVSALLLQEAARRAPKVAEEEKEGWFARFVRAFAAHPAMAAAAMLVIVVGVTTMVTRRGGDQFAHSTAPAAESTVQSAVPSKEEVPSGAEDRGVGGIAFGGSAAGDPTTASGSGATEQYRVDLADQQGQGESDKNVVKESAPEKLASGTKGGIEVRPGKPKAQPRELEGQDLTQKAPAVRQEEGAAFAADEPAKNKKADSDGDSERAGTVARGEFAKPPSPDPMPAPPPVQLAAPTTPSTAAVVAGNAPAGAASEGRVADPSLVAMRDQLFTQASQDCRAAASTAVRLWNRSAAYYDQNVAGDRRVAGCKQYIEPAISEQVAQRERALRAKSAETAKKRALDQSKPTTTKPAPTKPADSK